MIRALSAAAALTAAAVGAAPTASADPLADLMGMVPEGYGPHGCEPIGDNAPPKALTAVDCQNRVFPGGGPAPARYVLYGDPGTLESDFAADTSNKSQFDPLPCPGTSGIGPTKWSESDMTAGSISCGAQNDQSVLVWTKDSGPYLGVAVGKDLNALMSWWVATIQNPAN